MITSDDFRRMIRLLGEQAEEDIEWSETVCEPNNPFDFACEAIWVICNSGMKHTVARMIQDRVMVALKHGRPVAEVFGHKGKAAAMEEIWRDRETLWAKFKESDDKLAFCESLPWIGGITKFHLAKNYGLDVAKPDVHLQRCADREGTDAQGLCERLAKETGYRVATVDLVIWRACATGIMDSRTGLFAPERGGGAGAAA